ncbi:NPA domain-containing protein [Trichostrongylus colubriformis]
MKPPMDRLQPQRGSNKAIRNMLFASKLWLTSDQATSLNALQLKGDTDGVVRGLTDFYRGLRDKSRASLRVQSTCRAILSDEVGQGGVEELVSMKAKVVPTPELVAKLNSLFGKVRNSDVTAIQPLCVAAYEDSHVPTANDSQRLRRHVENAAAA